MPELSHPPLSRWLSEWNEWCFWVCPERTTSAHSSLSALSLRSRWGDSGTDQLLKECLLAELYGRHNPSTREARGRRTWWCHSAFLRTNPFLLLHSEPWIPSAWASQYPLCFIWPGMASLTLTSFDWLDKWTVYGCSNSVLLCWACHRASQGLPPIPSHLSGCPWCSRVTSFLRWVWDRERKPEGATEGRRGVETAQHHRTSSASFQESCKGGICLTGKTHNQKGQNYLAMSNCSCHLLFLDRGSLQRLPEQTFPEQMSPCWPGNDFSG